jgi:hypothetical protein
MRQVGKLSKRQTWNILPGVLMCCILLSACIFRPKETESNKDQQVEIWLQDDLDSTEEVIATRYTYFEAIEREIVRVKILDLASGKIREAVLDMQNGAQVDYDSFRDLALSAWVEQHGSATPALVSLLESAPRPATLVDVGVAPNDKFEEMQREFGEQDIEIISTYRPFVTLRSSAEQIREISLLPYVSIVAIHQPIINLSIEAAEDLRQPTLSEPHSLGSGVGWLTAILEPQSCVKRDHPDFSQVQWQPRFGDSDCDIDALNGHSTLVAGVLGAFRRTSETAGLWRGGLFEVDRSNVEAVEDMWARRPILVNASFTIGKHIDAVLIDKEVYENGTFVFNGSGNSRRREAHCYAYNALCVGGYLINQTPGNFGDDTIYMRSSYINDESNGREYPDVLGPAAVRTADREGDYEPVHGTSFSSPAVTGLAGLLLTHFPFPLFEKPALMRAVLMASAQAHPIPDNLLRIPDINDEIDDRMGVGAPNGDRAKAIMEQRTFMFKKVSPSTLGLQATFDVKVEERVRVVLAWDQCPGYTVNGEDNPQLLVDLDLSVRAPSNVAEGQVDIHTNVSFVDNKEVVEFVTRAAGQVSVIVSADRFGKCEADGNLALAPMGIAWTKEPAPSKFTNPQLPP